MGQRKFVWHNSVLPWWTKNCTELSDKIVGKEITSDILEIQPLTDKETFKSLGQYYSVIVSLKNEETEKSEHIIYGSVIID